ncbi:helix-turn-helix transcriptional regulator [Kyrpidia sp.]|uniref:helix-turn-helix domain-containing protein n=1 Tax=Kyrpidia sp. TaxID=2073077 RepID=UPI00258F7543|nr:helix-turn-helix transcriptional regulator [Kyrpidia sp.]
MKLTPEDVRIARQFLGLTQHELAQRIGVTDTLICHWERGSKKIPKDMETKITSALGMSAEIMKELTKLRHEMAL